MIEVKVNFPPDAAEKPKAYRRRVIRGMYRGMQAYLNKMSKYAANKNMNNPRTQPPSMPNLRNMTNRLWNSVTHSAVPRPLDLESDRVSGFWGSDRDYAYKHEFGGEFRETVAGHWRRNRGVRMGKGARAAAISHIQHMGGGVGHARALGMHYVRPYTYSRMYPERRMFRRAIEAKGGTYSDQALRAALAAVNAGRNPSAIEIEGQIK